MDTGSIDVRMIAIDIESVEDVEQSDEALVFSVRLSGTPSEGWLGEFDHLYTTLDFPIKPPVEFHDNTLRIQFLPRYDDELQRYLDFLGEICFRASEEVHLTIAIRTTPEKEERKRQFRNYLSKMRIREF